MNSVNTISYTPGTPHPNTGRKDHEIVSYNLDRVRSYGGYQEFSVGSGANDAIKIDNARSHCRIEKRHLTFTVNHKTAKIELSRGPGSHIDLQISSSARTYLDPRNDGSLDKSNSRKQKNNDGSETHEFSLESLENVNLDLRDECTIILAPDRSPYSRGYHQRYPINSIVIRSDGNGKLTFYKPDYCGHLDHPIGELNIPIPNDTSAEQARAANNSGKLFAGLD